MAECVCTWWRDTLRVNLGPGSFYGEGPLRGPVSGPPALKQLPLALRYPLAPGRRLPPEAEETEIRKSERERAAPCPSRWSSGTESLWFGFILP